MMQLLLSFGCGICFALGAVVGVTVASLIRSKDREDYAKEMKEHAKRVEDRLAVQVTTMAACLTEIQKRNDQALRPRPPGLPSEPGVTD